MEDKYYIFANATVRDAAKTVLLDGDVRRVTYIFCAKAVSKSATEFFLMAIKGAGPDDIPSDYSQSAIDAAVLAKSRWVRRINNKIEKIFEFTEAAKGWRADPIWPEDSMQEIIARSFKGRIIGSLSHPVIQEKGGRVDGAE